MKTVKTITMKDLQDPKQGRLFEWIEHNALYKSVSLDNLPIDNEVKEMFEDYIREREEATKERLRGW